jgi:hypothetical protein
MRLLVLVEVVICHVPGGPSGEPGVPSVKALYMTFHAADLLLRSDAPDADAIASFHRLLNESINAKHLNKQKHAVQQQQVYWLPRTVS